MTLKILVLFSILLLSSVTCLPRRFLFQDRCTQNPETGHINANQPENSQRDYDVDMTCKNGTIYWNYPTDTIDLHFKDDHAFTACFRDELGVAALELSDITTNTPKVFPTLFREDLDDSGKDYCVSSVDNNLIIKMHARFHAYVAGLSYQLRY